ncbi:MAG: Hsp33 family molecular chaperone [Alphaproteobacteria bacterium]
MTIEPPKPTGFERRPVDDLVLPFQVEKTGVRGRAVRLGVLIDHILRRHDYPEAVSEVLGEALVTAALLGSSLKFDGSLTVQTQSDGPVGFMVASFSAPGALRGYAKLDRDGWAALEADGKADKAAVLGDGVFALTIDPGPGMHRSQGLVSLSRDGIAACAHEYFQQSEQIATRLRLFVGRGSAHAPGPQKGAQKSDMPWRAGGILIQHLAASGGLTDDEENRARLQAEKAAGKKTLTDAGEDVEEAWNRVTTLLQTAEDQELVDPLLSTDRLLLRLFHEDGVRVFDPMPLSMDCRCTEDHIRDVLTRTGDSREDLVEDGRITVRCEFCNKDFVFDPETLALMGEPRSVSR